jgi:hypothetical protein
MAIDGLNAMDTEEARILRVVEDLRRQLKGWEDIVENIRAMRADSRRNHGGDLPPVVPAQYAGERLGPALASYLKARAGFKIPIARVLEDLRIGGASLGAKPQRHQQNLKITMRAKTKPVRWDENWTMWLADTATESPKPRNVSKKKNTVSDPGIQP